MIPKSVIKLTYILILYSGPQKYDQAIYFYLCHVSLYWVYRLIRLSSSNLNYLIGLGAIVLYVNVITLVIPTTNADFAAILCNVSDQQTYLNIVILFICSDQSLVGISGLLFVLRDYDYQNDQGLGHFQ